MARALAEVDAQQLAEQREADGGVVDGAAEVGSSTGDEDGGAVERLDSARQRVSQGQSPNAGAVR